MKMQGKQKFYVVLVLGMLSAIGPFSIDMYLPGFPAIASDLQTTVAHISLSLSSFFVGISLGQLLYGPLLDKYGRKLPLYFGLSLYILASIGCAFAVKADALIVLRLFQALGGCVGMVASRALVRDLFPVDENAKVFSLLVLVIGVSPIIAPTLGGYITATLGWKYVFFVLTLMGIFNLVAVHFFLPEGRKADRTLSLAPPAILKRFGSVIKDPQFYTYALTGSLAASGLYAYITGSPYVFMEIFEVTEKQYGWIFALIAMGLIGSSQVNSVLLKNFTSQQIVKVALLCQATTGLLLFIFTSFHLLEVFSTIFLIFIFLCCQGFTFPNTSALSLAPFTKTAGSASAVLGGTQMAMGAIASAMVSMLSNHTALPMTGVMAGCAVSSLVILMVGTRRIRINATQKKVEQESIKMMSTT
jgi:MFS transporter, DHA1 family, multidrug resistance protein